MVEVMVQRYRLWRSRGEILDNPLKDESKQAHNGNKCGLPAPPLSNGSTNHTQNDNGNNGDDDNDDEDSLVVEA